MPEIAATTTEVAHPLVEMIPLERIQASRSNPRKTFTEIDELAANVKAHGVLQPIMVRPNGSPDTYEIIFGERRYRAAKKAGLAEIPVMIRHVDDRTALEWQIVENSKRADVHPIEEASGYVALHETHGLGVEEIAAKVGKSKAHVYARLKLASGLCAEAREACLSEKISPSIGLLLARIPSQDLQREALAVITRKKNEDYGAGYDYGHPDEPMSYRAAVDFVHRRYTLSLKEAPFDTKDAELVPAAGACTKCPKRTGNQPELFADIKAKDTCTDPGCFASKKDASWAKQKAEAEAKGLKVLSDKEAKALDNYAGAYVEAGGYLGRGNFPTFGDAAAKAKLTPALARKANGAVVEVFERTEIEKALPKPKVHRYDATQNNEKWKAEQKLNRAIQARVTEKLVAKFETKEPDKKLWLFLAEAFAEDYRTDEVNGRRFTGGQLKMDRPELSDVLDYLRAVSEGELRGYVLECLTSVIFAERGPFLAWAGVDTKKIEAEVKAELKAAEKTAPAKDDKKPAKKSKAAGPIARKAKRKAG